eukprot:g2894.t1
MVSITYTEAFRNGGGERLGEFAELSERLQQRAVDEDLSTQLSKLLPRDYQKRAGFSTLLVNQPYVTELDELYAEARRVHADYTALVQRLADSTTPRGTAIVPPIKGQKRARMKALFKYADPSGGGEGGVAWYRLTDLVRATIKYPDIPSMYAGLQVVFEHFGANIKEFNDRFQRPMDGGYRDLQLVLEFGRRASDAAHAAGTGLQNYHMCELQLTTADMARAKETTGHRDYEVVRELKAAVGKGDLGRVFDALEFGAEHLGSERGHGGGRAALADVLRTGQAKTLMHKAAAAGHASIVLAFLQHGASPDAQDNDGNTALHHAVYGGHERTVWVLLSQSSPSLDVRNNKNLTALDSGYIMLWQRPPEHAVRAVSTLSQKAGAEHVAAARKVAEEELRRLKKNSQALVMAAGDGDVVRMREELRKYADPSSTDATGTSAIEVAIAGGHTAAVILLVEFGASVRFKPTVDRAPLLHRGAAIGSADIVRTLLENGVAATSLDAHGRAAMEIAVEGGHAAVCEVLLEKVPSSKEVLAVKEGQVPLLHRAAQGGHDRVVELLLSLGGDSARLVAVDARDSAGDTAMQLAVEARRALLGARNQRERAAQQHTMARRVTRFMRLVAKQLERAPAMATVVTQIMARFRGSVVSREDPREVGALKTIEYLASASTSFTSKMASYFDVAVEGGDAAVARATVIERKSKALVAERHFQPDVPIYAGSPLQDSADVELRNIRFTALSPAQPASHTARASAVQLLLEHGRRAGGAERALVCADDGDLRMLLRSRGGALGSLHVECRDGNIAGIQARLEAGADVNESGATDMESCSGALGGVELGRAHMTVAEAKAFALSHKACAGFTYKCDVEAAGKVYVRFKAGVTRTRADNSWASYVIIERPLAIVCAAAGGHVTAVQLLLERGASLEGERGAKSLVLASANGHVEVVRVLLGAGVPATAAAFAGKKHKSPLRHCHSMRGISSYRQYSGGDADQLRVGDTVDARCQGGARFSPGKIIQDNDDGTYGVQFTDSSRDRAVPKHSIAKLSEGDDKSDGKGDAEGGSYQEGDKIECRYRGKSRYYPGRIRRARLNGTYDIDYDDGERESSVSPDLIKCQGVAASQAQPSNDEAVHKVPLGALPLDMGREMSALEAASSGGHLDTVRLLMLARQTIDNQGRALVAASDSGHVHVLQLLLGGCAASGSDGAVLSSAIISLAKGPYGEEALAKAAAAGHIEALRVLVVAGATFAPVASDKGYEKDRGKDNMGTQVFVRGANKEPGSYGEIVCNRFDGTYDVLCFANGHEAQKKPGAVKTVDGGRLEVKVEDLQVEPEEEPPKFKVGDIVEARVPGGLRFQRGPSSTDTSMDLQIGETR